MNYSITPYQEVLSENIITELYEKFEVDLRYDKPINFSSFIGNYALVSWNDYYDYNSFIIDRKGNFPIIELSSQLTYKDGEIVKTEKLDNGTYFYEITPICQSNHIQSGFYHFKVIRWYSNKQGENRTFLHFILNPELKVIAEFIDNCFYPVEYDGFKMCEVFVERSFYFPSSDRNYLIFSQKTIVDCVDDDRKDEFYSEHIEYIAPNEYGVEAYMTKGDFAEYYNSLYYEYEWSEEDWSKIVEDEDNNVCEIYDDKDSSNYGLTDYFAESYGIIDCKIKAETMLYPFTYEQKCVEKIISARLQLSEDFSKYGMLHGWRLVDNHYEGPILNNRFMVDPRFRGLSLKYMSKYYSKELVNLVKWGHILIPSNFLSEISSYPLYLEICMLQECHLEFASIKSVGDKLKSVEKYGLISMFQNKTIEDIVHIKGGTKYLRRLMLCGRIDIEKTVLQDLFENSIDSIEQKCYEILISVYDYIDMHKEDVSNAIDKDLEEYVINGMNKEFDDLISDMGAWYIID